MSNVLKSITRKGEVKYFWEPYTKYNKVRTIACTKMLTDNDWSSALLYYKYNIYILYNPYNNDLYNVYTYSRILF